MKKFYLPFLKGVLVLVIFILVLQILISLIGDYYAGRWLKHKIRSSSDSLYALQYDDLDIGLFSGSIQFHNLRFTTDTTAWPDTLSGPPTVINGTTDDMELNGISLWHYLFGSTLSIESITFNEPNFDIMPGHPRPDKKPKQSSSFSSIDSSIYATISGQFRTLSVDQIAIKDGQFVTHKMEAPTDTSFWANGFDLRLRNIRVDSATAHSQRLFVTDNIHCTIKHFGQHLPGKFYNLSLQNFLLSSADQRLSMDSLQFLPRYPKYEFSRRKGTQIDRITLKAPHIGIHDIDFDQSINHGHFYAKTGEITQPRLKVFHDKSMPSGPPGKPKPLPYITFKQMHTKIKIDTLAITDGYISYSEQKAKLNQPGTVSFKNISAVFSGISNYKKDRTDDYVVKIKTHSKVMGTGSLNVNFSFPMGDNAGRHQIEGSLGMINATAFNKATEYIALVRFTDGIIHHLNFSMNVNKYGAQGKLTADYENLKIKVLKQKNQQAKGEKTLKSFIANNFVVRGSNHKPPLGEAAIRFKRKEPKSLFNLWWNVLLSGLKEQFDLF